MKPTIDLFFGAPLEHESEKCFLGKLSEDLLAQSHSALIFANFFPPRYPYQIDFLVVTEQCACHVELKKLTAPVVGGINGLWSLQKPDNSLAPLEAKNPYRQALDGKYAISDQMRTFATADPSIPRPKNNRKYYEHLESVLCVFPELLPGSSVYQDRKVRVRGYRDLLTLLTHQQTNPGWSKDNWIGFAMHLGLIRAEDAEDRTPPESRLAQQAVAEYGARFEDFYGRDLPALVSTPIEAEGKPVSADALLKTLLSGEHMQLVGPSGYGKSLLAKHMAISAIREGRLSIFACAKDYEGKLSSLLDRSVAHLFPDTAIQFLNAAALCGSPVTLVLDGFNECHGKRKKELVKDLQAFYLRWPVPILITTQEVVQVPEPLSGATLCFGLLNNGHKTAVLRSYLGDRLPVDAEVLSESFHTPYELSLAADSMTEFGGRATRAALFDSYVQRRCEQTTNAALTRGVLSAIADRMRRRLMSSLTANEVRRLAAATLGRDGRRTHHLAEALECGLLDMRQGRCGFRHELLERFFQAEALMQEYASGDGLPKALTLPRNRDLIEFVIGVETDQEVIRHYLAAVADSSVLGNCLFGRYGEVARDVVMEDCSKVLLSAERALEEVDVQLTDGEPSKQLALIGGPSWSTYDVALMWAVGEIIPEGMFLNEAFRLIARTDEKCQSDLAEKAGPAGKLNAMDAMHLFAALYVYTIGNGRAIVPASKIYHAARYRLMFKGLKGDQNAVRGVLENLDSRTPGELFLLCELLRRGGQELGLFVSRLLKTCWKTGLYHLRVDGLEMAEWNAPKLEGAERAEVISVLGSLHSRNGLLSTSIVEAMLAYDMVESPVNKETAAEELAEILRFPDDPQARELASHAVSNIFEEVFQDAYWGAMEALSDDARVQLLTMAALGAPECDFSVEWTLKELLLLEDERTLPAFQHWATKLEAKSCFPQQAVGCYVLGVIGCARFLAEPTALVQPQNDVERAWQAYGGILFWLYKPGLSTPERRAAAAPSWQQLHADLPFDAVDPIMGLERVKLTSSRESRRVIDDLCSRFPDEVRQILEFGLKNRTRLTGLLGRIPWQKETAQFIIRWLGVVGDRGTVRVLEPIIDTADLGPYAVEAVRKLKAPNPTV
jgi:Nuclease-related domain